MNENFSANLKWAMRRKGVSMKEAADTLGWDRRNYEWLRRISTGGIERITEKKRLDLGRLCSLLGVANQDWLWAKPTEFQNAMADKRVFFTIADFRTINVDDSNYWNEERKGEIEVYCELLELGLPHDDAAKLVAWFRLANRLNEWDLAASDALLELGRQVVG